MGMNNQSVQIRSRQTKFELREAQIGEGDNSTTARYISGYAATFNEPSTGLWFSEIIEPGAFDETDFSNCKCVFNHDENIILGSVSGGTLNVVVDDVGLRYECQLPDTQYVREIVIAPMERGDLDKSSFRFAMDTMASSETWDYDRVRDMDIRKIHKIASVLDVSPVLFPAYEASSSSVRSAASCEELRSRAQEARAAANSKEEPKKRFFSSLR